MPEIMIKMREQILCWLLGGDRWSPQRGSTVNFHFHVKRRSPLLILGGIDDCLREDQQSTFTFTWKGNHLCWSLGGRGEILPLRTVQPHYLHAKHGVQLVLLTAVAIFCRPWQFFCHVYNMTWPCDRKKFLLIYIPLAREEMPCSVLVSIPFCYVGDLGLIPR